MADASANRSRGRDIRRESSLRRLHRTARLATLVLLCAFPSMAQEEEAEPLSRAEMLRRLREAKAAKLEPYRILSGEARFLALENARLPQKVLQKGWRGLRPVIGGMPSGSGFVFGGGYIYGLAHQRFQFQVNGRRSTRGYTVADAELVIPPPQAGRRIEVKFQGQYRDLTSLRFYGLGNDSVVEDRSHYLLNDQSATGYFWLNPRGLLSLGAKGGFVRTRTDRGREDRSIDDVFDPGDIPGFRDPRTEFAVTGGWVELDLREKWQEPPVGVVGRFTTERYEDTGISRYDFTRVIGDVKAYVPLGARNRILALRLYTSHSMPDEGKEVPFYLMETLGGAKDIRGFREFRFRDTRNFLVSAEYRWEVWTYADFTLFLDAGKVFRDPGDFDFDGMRTGYGFGIRAHSPTGVVLRFDLAKSTEGFRFHVSGGPSF